MIALRITIFLMILNTTPPADDLMYIQDCKIPLFLGGRNYGAVSSM